MDKLELRTESLPVVTWSQDVPGKAWNFRFKWSSAGWQPTLRLKPV